MRKVLVFDWFKLRHVHFLLLTLFLLDELAKNEDREIQLTFFFSSILELTKKFSFAFWIGLNTLNFNSGWQWAGGSPFRYLNWAPGKICIYLVIFE